MEGRIHYHSIIKSIRGRVIFYTDVDRLLFLNILRRFTDKHSITIIEYVLMDNHVHILHDAQSYDHALLFIKEMQQNNMVAFGELYRRHHDYLVSFASLNVGKKNIAEDIVHDVFIKLWQNKGNIEPVDSLRPYLLRAVHNNSLNILRNESKCLGFRNEYVEKIERAASSIYNPDKNEVIKSLYVKDAQSKWLSVSPSHYRCFRLPP